MPASFPCSPARVDELNAAFAKVQEGKEDFSSTVARMQTDLEDTMDEAARTVDSAVQEMDMYREAAQSARSTMQGFIDGANGMADSVQSAYRSVAAGAMSAIQGVLGAGLSVTRGYASGTTAADPGFAVVGENGPELVFFRGGEQVMNARETAAIQRQSAVSATPAGGYGGGQVVINLSPVYNLSGGMDAAGIRNELARHTESLRQLVRDVMEECQVESARRRY